ncbi:ER-golgi trafficking TRAPP I complex 85 kDa subunit-domain-containing protein [Mycena floridula]|nr:ER-golgi trafficking TRAPP I complex 85 kDa subunit-domain-containing protein [Mycena floridula]
MAPALPSSLSPHICVLPSPDLTELLVESSLPPLHHILQSFSPFPQVTTRTTSLNSVPHTSFALRFSDLSETESACHEDEEQRAGRTIDWISARIGHRCAKWVQDMEKVKELETLKTPWWEELKRCVEGDYVPSRTETWNHPVAIILAVSTNAPNPLQAITALHSRAIQFPAWVDTTFIRYTVIIHPQDSALSDEEAGALYNAVKKQFGLHSYLLPLSLPQPPPKPVPVPALMPRLPPAPSDDSPTSVLPTPTPTTTNFDFQAPKMSLNTLKMCDKDIQQTARFTREFLVMSLVPWMEKCVVDWNEAFSSTRRLPSRLFSSTRRLFGSPSPSPAPVSRLPGSSSSSSLPTRTSTPSINGSSDTFAPPPQQRRLAEFATILGDFKLAVTVWESLRKESKGGSDILPLLISPSPAVQLHAANALSNIQTLSPEVPARVQMRALLYAVRWEIGIGHPEFFDHILEGERWLVWAAGNAEESPSAILLAHAALLSSKKQARRRAALLYFSAANRLEKCGIKPLTMYFLRRAHEMYKVKPHKELSPSFWDAAGKSPADKEDGFDSITSGIEHPLGRLLYTTGDVESAVRFFLGLLRGTPPGTPAVTPLPSGHGDLEPQTADKVFLEDFRVSLAHYKTTAPKPSADFKLPVTFCQQKQTRLRLARDVFNRENSQWEKLEEDWIRFSKASGVKEGLTKSGKASVDETFWVDLVLRNPLNVEVNLTNLTVVVQDSSVDGSSSSTSFVEVEVVDDVMLGAKETRILPISIRSSRPVSLSITHVTYDFLSLLPSTEPLSYRGRRLNETMVQRLTPTYAPDVILQVNITEASHRLVVSFADEQQLVLGQGETKLLRLWFTNSGTKAVKELWMIPGAEDQIWLHDKKDSDIPVEATVPHEDVESINTLTSRKPYRVSLGEEEYLQAGDSMEISLVLHADQAGDNELCILFVYRQSDSEPFNPVRAIRYYEVQPIFKIICNSRPSAEADNLFTLNLELENITSSATVAVHQVTILSPTWKFEAIDNEKIMDVLPQQSCRMVLGATPTSQTSTASLDFVRRKLRDVLRGVAVDRSEPPPAILCCSHTPQARSHSRSMTELATRHFIHGGRRNFVTQNLALAHPHIPPQTHHAIFPLYHPHSVDVVVFWEIISQQRSGHLLIPGFTMGADHAPLAGLIEEVENAKITRSMYAETRREKLEVIQAIASSEWNAETDPMTIVLRFEPTIKHDFSQGPHLVPVEFNLRNHSLTHKLRYLLRLTSEGASALDLPPAPYHGKTTFRGILESTELAIKHSKIWIHRPGAYLVAGWRLDLEVLEPGTEHVLQHYNKTPPAVDGPVITACEA